jgi:hypothetical protein
VQASTGCKLIGADSVQAGTIATYALVGCKASNWQTSAVTVNYQNDSLITICFNAAGVGTLKITAVGSGVAGVTKQVVIKPALTLAGGSINDSLQMAMAQTFPGKIQASPATQGLCNGVYSYQWYQSKDNIHFVPIQGAIGQHYQPGMADSTTYFKRQTLCNGVTAYTSNVATVQVQPHSGAGSIFPAVQAINSHGKAAAMIISIPSIIGVVYTYQWESATSLSSPAWRPIPGATSPSYEPAATDSTIYYRVVALDQQNDSINSLQWPGAGAIDSQ